MCRRTTTSISSCSRTRPRWTVTAVTAPDSALPPLNLPDDPGSDPDLGYPPTTEDFDSGTGSIGICADGTLSHSIGHQGACSYHGGVG